AESSKIMSSDLIEIIELNIDYINKKYKKSNTEYQKLYAAFVKHSFERVLILVMGGQQNANKEYLTSYKKLVLKHFVKLLSNNYISNKYKIGFITSFISINLFSLISRIRLK